MPPVRPRPNVSLLWLNVEIKVPRDGNGCFTPRPKPCFRRRTRQEEAPWLCHVKTQRETTLHISWRKDKLVCSSDLRGKLCSESLATAADPKKREKKILQHILGCVILHRMNMDVMRFQTFPIEEEKWRLHMTLN